MKLGNRTPFLADLTVSQNREGRDHFLVTLKATCSLNHQRRPIPADVHHREPATSSSSFQFEGDFIPKTPFTNVVLVGPAKEEPLGLMHPQKQTVKE